MKITTNFPGGNGKDFKFLGKDHIRFTHRDTKRKIRSVVRFFVEEVDCK